MNVTRIALAAAVAVSGVSHAYLYVHGYHHIPLIGTAFLVEAGMLFALALLILIGGPSWLRWVAAALSGGALVAFALSRTVGLFGFSEWDGSRLRTPRSAWPPNRRPSDCGQRMCSVVDGLSPDHDRTAAG